MRCGGPTTPGIRRWEGGGPAPACCIPPNPPPPPPPLLLLGTMVFSPSDGLTRPPLFPPLLGPPVACTKVTRPPSVIIGRLTAVVAVIGGRKFSAAIVTAREPMGSRVAGGPVGRGPLPRLPGARSAPPPPPVVTRPPHACCSCCCCCWETGICSRTPPTRPMLLMLFPLLLGGVGPRSVTGKATAVVDWIVGCCCCDTAADGARNSGDMAVAAERGCSGPPTEGAARTGRVLGRIWERGSGGVALLGIIVMLEMERLLGAVAVIGCLVATRGAVVDTNGRGGAGITDT